MTAFASIVCLLAQPNATVWCCLTNPYDKYYEESRAVIDGAIALEDELK